MFEPVRKARAGNEKGFTLIELMIVVAIIGILAAIAIPQFSAYRERAYLASQKSDCHAIKIAEETYFADHEEYKTTADPATDLQLYGFKVFSAGNSGGVVVTTVADGTDTFAVTIDSEKTNKNVVYDSATGLTTTS